MLQYKMSELHEEWVRTAENSEQAKRRDVKSSEQII